MSNVCEPCLMVITRYERRCNSAARRTVRVVLPWCLRPMIATIGGVVDACGMSLREHELVRGVHVQEHQRGIAEAPDLLIRQPCDAHVIEKADDTPIACVEVTLDGTQARWIIIRAQRLDTTRRRTFRHGDICATTERAQRAEQRGRNKGHVPRDDENWTRRA